jgi:hypothetical protein
MTQCFLKKTRGPRPGSIAETTHSFTTFYSTRGAAEVGSIAETTHSFTTFYSTRGAAEV